MAHISENINPLIVSHISIESIDTLYKVTKAYNNVCVLRLPPCDNPINLGKPLQDIGNIVSCIAANLGDQATVITLGEIVDLVQVQAYIPSTIRYQHWIAIKRASPKPIDNHFLPNHHFGALIHTRYKASLHHAKTRIRYTYCPFCNKTTKDYGGKKHTYHKDGTLISDVWRDIECDLDGDISSIINRTADLFGIEPYKELSVFDCRLIKFKRERTSTITVKIQENNLSENFTNKVIEGDCLEILHQIPDNSIDFIFTDPPYNLGKKYYGYSDNLEVKEYFMWCDSWIAELARVLKPGRTFSIINIPLWAVRHFLFMKTMLDFQNWIVWDALAFPVRLIMPAHYTILCFSKGAPRKLPGLTDESGDANILGFFKAFNALKPLADGYCLRSDCVDWRHKEHINDRNPLTDLWTDIHRLKHNSRRVDHPCQIPPRLMYRLISIFTKPDEIVLDCFNGSGTTTLTAAQLGRKYIGIEMAKEYCLIARERHEEILIGQDPFRKKERILTSKNSPVPRLPKQKYTIPKKVLQLEVKRIANQLGHLPTRDEVIKFGKYPIDYYDKYFISWGEVCAAARTTGMTEERESNKHVSKITQLSFFPE